MPAHIAGEDPESVRFLNEGYVSELEGTLAWVERNRESWRIGGAVRSFAVCDAATGTLLGTAEANLDWERLGYEPGWVNISYQVYPLSRGRGVASRAVELVVAYVADLDAAERAVLSIDPQNVASLRVAGRTGFTHAEATMSGSSHHIYTRVLSGVVT